MQNPHIILDVNVHNVDTAIPQDYGGNGPSGAALQASAMYRRLREHSQRNQESLTLKYDALQKRIEPLISAHKEVASTLGTLIASCAFIAGVQASTIPWSMDSNETPYRVAINWFAFNGLVLDIAGGMFGSARLVYHGASAGILEQLWERIKNHRELFEKYSRDLDVTLASLKDNLEQLTEIEDSLDNFPNSFDELLKLQSRTIFIATSRTVADLSQSIEEPKSHLHDKLVVGGVETIVKHIGGSIPSILSTPFYTTIHEVVVLSMATGMLFLLISVIMAVVETQLKSVWASCISFSAFTALYTFRPAFPPVYQWSSSQVKAKSKGSSRQSPPSGARAGKGKERA